MIRKDRQKKHLARISEIPSSSQLGYFCCHRINQGLVKKQFPRVPERDVRQRRTKKAPQHDTEKAPLKIIILNSLPQWLKKQRMRLCGSGGQSLNVLLIAFIT